MNSFPLSPLTAKAYTWWNFTESKMEYTGTGESLAAVRKVFEEQGPFDGVLGFSQGAVMTAVLCGLKNENLPENAWANFKFAILISGFKPRALELGHLFSKPIEVPTFHMIGQTDEMVAPARSMDLYGSFGPNSVLFTHGGAHYIVADQASKAALLSFLERFLPTPTSS